MQLFCHDYGKVMSKKITTKFVVKSWGGGGGRGGLTIALNHVLTHQVILYHQLRKENSFQSVKKTFPALRFQKRRIP